MKNRSAIIIIIGVLSVVIIIGVCGLCFTGDEYSSIKTWLQANARHGNFVREIGTNKDFWLNGYLGIFFRFKMFGWLNWLAIPLFIYFLITIKKRKRWEIALCLALFLACIFLCYKGYRNYRYQLTLFPVLITIIFLFGWQVLRKKNRKVIGVIILICSCMLLGNCYSLRDSYKYYWKSAIGHGKHGERFPYKLIEYINENVSDDSVMVERNQPILHYYTSKKKKLRGQGKSKYILIRGGSVAGYDLVCEEQGYKLYKKKEAGVPNNLTIKYFNKKKPDFETDFSNWTGKDEVSMNDISKTVAPMVMLGNRGNFVFKRIFSDSGNIVRVILSQPEFNKKSVILFGYRYQTNGFRLKVNDGDIVSVIASVRLSKQAGRAPELFVQDKTDYWVREKVYYKDASWRDVLVSKRIREGFTNICIGISWEPEFADEWLEIKSIRVHVSAKDR